MRYFQVVSIIIVMVFVISCNSSASPSPTPLPTPTQNIASSPTIKLVTGDYPPFSGETLPHQGITPEIMRWVFEGMDKPVTIEFKPWERGFQETLHGDYFGTFPYVKTEERETQFLFSDPLFNVDSYFFVQADSEINYTKDEDLTGRKICRPDGWALYRLKDLAEKGNISLEKPTGMDLCFKMLQNKRVDMLLVSESTGWATVDEVFGSRSDFKMLPTPFSQATFYLMVSKTYPQSETLLAEFNKNLTKVHERGDIKTLLAKELK